LSASDDGSNCSHSEETQAVRSQEEERAGGTGVVENDASGGAEEEREERRASCGVGEDGDGEEYEEREEEDGWEQEEGDLRMEMHTLLEVYEFSEDAAYACEMYAHWLDDSSQVTPDELVRAAVMNFTKVSSLCN